MVQTSNSSVVVVGFGGLGKTLIRRKLPLGDVMKRADGVLMVRRQWIRRAAVLLLLLRLRVQREEQQKQGRS